MCGLQVTHRRAEHHALSTTKCSTHTILFLISRLGAPPPFQKNAGSATVLDIQIPSVNVINMTQNVLDLHVGLQHFQARDFIPKFGTAHRVNIHYNFHSPHD